MIARRAHKDYREGFSNGSPIERGGELAPLSH